MPYNHACVLYYTATESTSKLSLEQNRKSKLKLNCRRQNDPILHCIVLYRGLQWMLDQFRPHKGLSPSIERIYWPCFKYMATATRNFPKQLLLHRGSHPKAANEKGREKRTKGRHDDRRALAKVWKTLSVSVSLSFSLSQTQTQTQTQTHTHTHI